MSANQKVQSINTSAPVRNVKAEYDDVAEQLAALQKRANDLREQAKKGSENRISILEQEMKDARKAIEACPTCSKHRAANVAATKEWQELTLRSKFVGERKPKSK